MSAVVKKITPSTYILSQLADSCDIADCKNCYLSYKGLALAPHDTICVPFDGDVFLCWKLYGGGQGRKKEGRKFHPNRDCLKCVYCGREPADGRFTHPESWEKKQLLFVTQLSLKPNECRKCNTALLKQIKSTKDAQLSAKRKITKCDLVQLGKCNKHADQCTHIGNKEMFSTCFNVNVDEEVSVFALCKAHYNLYYRFTDAVNCDACGCSFLKPNSLRCAQISVLPEMFNKYFPEHVSDVAQDLFLVCSRCYKLYLKLLKQKIPHKSYDWQLNSLLENLDIDKFPSKFLSKVPTEIEIITTFNITTSFFHSCGKSL